MLKLKNSSILKSIIIFMEIAFLIVVIFSLPGCQKELNEERTPRTTLETPVPDPNEKVEIIDLKEVLSPATLPYIVNNSLEYIEEDTSQEILYSFTGLLDHDLESMINSEIQRRYSLLKESGIPPYRGILKNLNKEKPMESEGSYTFQNFSAYNLLSVQMEINRNYPHKNSLEPSILTRVLECYNVDLNTGRELFLKDLFTNDADYKNLINSSIQKEVNRTANITSDEFSDEELTLVYPFTGIKENQKFLLTPSELLIIIDYEMPEFNTNFTYSMVRIPFRDLERYLAIKQRFYDDAPNLYEKPNMSKELVSYFPSNIKGKIDQRETDSLYITYTLKYPENISILWENILLRTSEFDEDKIEKFVSENPKATQYILEYYGNITGSYFSINQNSIISSERNSEFKSEETVYDQKGNIVEIKDLFTPGFLFDEIIDEELRLAIEENPTLKDFSFTEIKSSLTFSINSSSLTFNSKPLDFGEGQNHPLSFYVDFKDFGFENLVFFIEPST